MNRIDPTAKMGAGCDFGFGAVVMAGAEVGDGVSLGHHTVVYPGVRIGPGTRVQDNSVIGRPTITSRTSTRQADERPPLVVGAGCIIGCSVVLYWGSEIGDGVMVADLASVREGCRIGAGSIVGRACVVEYDTVIGERVKIQSAAYITGNMVIEDDVFIGPSVSTANDGKMDRVKGEPFAGPVIRRAARIGANATILPGVAIGADSVVAAGAVVLSDVSEHAVVAGVPAAVKGTVAESERFGHVAETE